MTLHRKFGVPMARYLFDVLLRYLKKYNPHSARTIPPSARQPVFVIHTGASLATGGPMHVKPWLPHLLASGQECLIVARTMDTYEALRDAYPDLAISLVNGTESLDLFFRTFPSVRAVFYVANTPVNNHFLRYPGITHVSLGHGDSDKSASVSRVFKMYDEVFVAGQAHVDRFAGADFDSSAMKFRIIGRPQVARLLARCAAVPPAIARIVYLPTWEGHHADQKYTSLPLAAQLLAAVGARAGGLRVQAKLHPVTGAIDRRYRNIQQDILDALPDDAVEFVDRSLRLDEVLGQDAVYICDVSATVSECLALDRPIFVYLPPGDDIRIISGKLSYADYAYTFRDVEELAGKLDQILAGHDPLAAARRAAREYFISPDATLEGAFDKALARLAATQGPNPAPVARVPEPLDA